AHERAVHAAPGRWPGTGQSHRHRADAPTKMRGKAIPQRVQGYRLVDLGHQRRGMAGAVELACRERVDPVLPGKQPALWPRFLPPGPQQIEEIPREHDIAVLVALALLDP